MDSILDGLEAPPDGEGYWPDRFVVDRVWADGRGISWRAVMNCPTLQAKRIDLVLSVRLEGTTVAYNYQLSLVSNEPGMPAFYLAERI